MTTTLCDDCGERYAIGDWPLCPHGKPIGYHPFVPYVDEHIAEKPVLITSQYHRRQVMRQNNCDFAGRKRGMPGQEI